MRLGGALGRLGSKMAPTWRRRGSHHGARMAKKIDLKLDHFSDASWGRCLAGF